MNSVVKIRPLQKLDYAGWLILWDGNNLGTRDAQVTAQTWGRLNDTQFPVHGLIAFENNQPVGLLHYVVHPTTGSLKDVCYMQDVYVDPAYRKKGIARAMIEELSRIGKLEQKWARIYWLAEANNEAAQRLYKNLGVRLDFTLHVIPMT